MKEKIKILLVDDSPIIRHVGSKILTKKGFEVLQGENGAKALDIYEKNTISLIVLDYHMPVMDGLQVINEIRGSAYKNKTNVPILILSGEDNPGEITKLIEAGADDYVNKLRLKATPEIFMEKVYGLLNFQKEVEYYKTLKLSNTLSPQVKEFKKFVQKCVDNYFSGQITPIDEVLSEMNKKI